MSNGEESERNTICALIHSAYEKNMKMTNGTEAPVRHVLHQRRLWRDLQDQYGKVPDAEEWAKSQVLPEKFILCNGLSQSTTVLLERRKKFSATKRRLSRLARMTSVSDDEEDEDEGNQFLTTDKKGFFRDYSKFVPYDETIPEEDGIDVDEDALSISSSSSTEDEYDAFNTTMHCKRRTASTALLSIQNREHIKQHLQRPKYKVEKLKNGQTCITSLCYKGTNKGSSTASFSRRHSTGNVQKKNYFGDNNSNNNSMQSQHQLLDDINVDRRDSGFLDQEEPHSNRTSKNSNNNSVYNNSSNNDRIQLNNKFVVRRSHSLNNGSHYHKKHQKQQHQHAVFDHPNIRNLSGRIFVDGHATML
eukprot:m.98623 g.98623  ORF g.98623 m.98623 type:complete len:361 (+) comp12526_c2_seq1:144-1226(+)